MFDIDTCQPNSMVKGDGTLVVASFWFYVVVVMLMLKGEVVGGL